MFAISLSQLVREPSDRRSSLNKLLALILLLNKRLRLIEIPSIISFSKLRLLSFITLVASFLHLM